MVSSVLSSLLTQPLNSWDKEARVTSFAPCYVSTSLTKPLSTLMSFPLCWLILTDCINIPSQCPPPPPHVFAMSWYCPLSWQTLYQYNCSLLWTNLEIYLHISSSSLDLANKIRTCLLWRCEIQMSESKPTVAKVLLDSSCPSPARDSDWLQTGE